ncbi:phage tail tube assembly chaperone [Lentilactobacillus kosonis]|uniref:Tail assembly chaperone n=1 Tax=Lentilactobacillus kosonis TaxID=2810561 RepID=A0A401FPR0_9LACO|nr:phage tail tube assembly chaperone [Lentilactobacillus kosonis]GAY74352.1 hypothetical protein NBRC111893_2498 [Lentilactobacillus kosonis]
MTVKINAKKLGIKAPVEVKESNRNFLKILKIQKQMLKVQTLSEDASDEDLLTTTIESNEAVIDFITDILRLDSKHADKLMDLSTEETGELMQQIILKLQHQDPEELNEAQADEAEEQLTETEKK